MNNSKLTHSVYRLLPFLLWINRVNRHSIRCDLLAGFTGALIVLPQGVAYALIAGLPAEYGLYTAIITPIVAGLFGSSWHLVSGPTAAISIVVFGVVSGITTPGSPEFIPLVLTLTLLVGAFQLVLGLLRVGALVNFISHTVVIGFTAGAAVLIATSQLKHILGIDVQSGLSFYATVMEINGRIDETNLTALVVSVCSLVSAIFFKRLFPKVPNMLLAMAAGTLLCLGLDGEGQGVALVGALPEGLPPISLFELRPDKIGVLSTGALAIAIIALIEAVSIARAISLRSRQRIDGNQEFVGQGLSNLAGSLFSCYAGSGSFTRSGVNYDSGAKTPFAAIFAAFFLCLIIISAPEITAHLPMPVMGGIVVLIAWNLIDFHHIRQIIHISREEAAILLATFTATLLFPLEFAIYAGVVLSIALFLRHSAKPKLVSVVPIPYRAGTPLRSAARHQLDECDKVKVLRLDGELFFGSVNHIQRELQFLSEVGHAEHILLVGSGVNYIDLAGAEMLVEEARRLESQGIALHLSNFKGTALATLKRGDFEDQIGKEFIHVSHHVALKQILPLINCQCKVDSESGLSTCVINRSYGQHSEKESIESSPYRPSCFPDRSVSSGSQA